jgi:hypothetical protein
VPRWSELPAVDPDRLAIELAKLGIDDSDLAADIRDVPERKAIAENLTSESARLRLALEWFGDNGHPQPVERTEWLGTGRTPAWGRLPRLKDDSRTGPTRASKQGKWEGKAFSPTEVDKVAAFYMKNHDLTPWEVWTLYKRVRNLENSGRPLPQDDRRHRKGLEAAADPGLGRARGDGR